MSNPTVPAAATGLPKFQPPLPSREHRALRDICDFADVLDLPSGTWLLVPASPPLLDLLAAFEAEQEDFEDGHDEETVNEDGGDINDEPQDEDTDREPWLGSSELRNQEYWAQGNGDNDDAEMDDEDGGADWRLAGRR